MHRGHRLLVQVGAYQVADPLQGGRQCIPALEMLVDAQAYEDRYVAGNGAPSTTDAEGNLRDAASYVCTDVQDYVFLLSQNEITRAAYGFDAYNEHDPARLKKLTDYAQCQGTQTYQDTYTDNGWWWLRSPHYSNMGDYVCEVYNDGCTYGANNVSYTTYGSAPLCVSNCKKTHMKRTSHEVRFSYAA